MTQQRISIPKKRLRQFCTQYRVRRLALFGSALRDDFTQESDIDLLVLFDPDARVSFLTLGRMQRELSVLFNRQVDLVPQAGLKPVIRDSYSQFCPGSICGLKRFTFQTSWRLLEQESNSCFYKDTRIPDFALFNMLQGDDSAQVARLVGVQPECQ